MLEEQIRRTALDARKQDAREKIELGGLIVKAGLREADRAIILGALIELVQRIGDPDEGERLRRIGVKALGGKA